jgi:hypothetical protein
MEQNESQLFINQLRAASIGFRTSVEGKWGSKKPKDIDSLCNLLEFTKEARNILLDISTIISTWNFNGHIPERIKSKQDSMTALTRAAWTVMEEVEGTLYDAYYEEQDSNEEASHSTKEPQEETQVEFDTETLARLALYAHSNNLTINDAINEILKDAITDNNPPQ